MRINGILRNQGKRDIPFDIQIPINDRKKPLIVFCHGFKGFKDWGHFNLIANHFERKGFAFLKFNFSHNGCTSEEQIDFPDLDAFGKNTYSLEQDDLNRIFDYIPQLQEDYQIQLDLKNITLIGHSRGGGSALLFAIDKRVHQVITLAAVSTFDRWDEETYKQWQNDGIMFIENSRTNQLMPLEWGLIEDLRKNASTLSIKNACKGLNKAVLIIHGNKDEAVDIQEGRQLKRWLKKGQLIEIEDGNHTFGGIHPYQGNELPEASLKALKSIHNFIA